MLFIQQTVIAGLSKFDARIVKISDDDQTHNLVSWMSMLVWKSKLNHLIVFRKVEKGKIK